MKLSTSAEVIGVIAVVLSLIFVAYELRQNTEAVRVANHQALVAMDIEKNAWLRDRDFAATHVLAREDLQSLTPAQSRQYLTFLADTFNAWEFAHITYSSGAMSENIWNGWDGFYRSEFATEGGRKFWKDGGHNFSSEFRAYVDSLVRDLE
jgi:hypothetical protein